MLKYQSFDYQDTSWIITEASIMWQTNIGAFTPSIQLYFPKKINELVHPPDNILILVKSMMTTDFRSKERLRVPMSIMSRAKTL